MVYITDFSGSAPERSYLTQDAALLSAESKFVNGTLVKGTGFSPSVSVSE
jgi:hypothetical protein